MNKDQIKGQTEEVKGKIEEAAGVILDDKSMQIEGNIKKNVGKAQSALGDLRQAGQFHSGNARYPQILFSQEMNMKLVG